MEQFKYGKDIEEALDEISELVTGSELMDVIAEEAIEVAHAALKLKRTVKPNLNPTDGMSYEHAKHNLLTEIADLRVGLLAAGYIDDSNYEKFIADMVKFKTYRWLDRLKEQQQKAGGAV